MSDGKGASHILLVPWPISSGIWTLCGIDAGGEHAANQYITGDPTQVTCARCKNAARQMQIWLAEWVPKLGE